MVWEETQLVVERINGRLASEGTILQAAASVAVAAFGKDGGKKAHQEFTKLMKRLSGDADSPDSGKLNLTDKLIKERGRNGR